MFIFRVAINHYLETLKLNPMIIFGSGSTSVDETLSEQITCSNCSTKGSTYFQTTSRHFHIFWIPMFPIGKDSFTICEHCKLTLNSKEMPEDVKRKSAEIRRDTKAKLWQFSGLILIALMAIPLAISIFNDNKASEEYINSPQAGDIYKTKMKDMYSLSKVTRVNEDSVFMVNNEYETDKGSKVYKLDEDANYEENEYGLHRLSVIRMHSMGYIEAVKRD